MENITIKCFSEMGGRLLGVYRYGLLNRAAVMAQRLRSHGYYVTIKIEAGPVEYRIWG